MLDFFYPSNYTNIIWTYFFDGFGWTHLSSISLFAVLCFSAMAMSLPCCRCWPTGSVAMLSTASKSTVATFTSASVGWCLSFPITITSLTGEVGLQGAHNEWMKVKEQGEGRALDHKDFSKQRLRKCGGAAQDRASGSSAPGVAQWRMLRDYPETGAAPTLPVAPYFL